MTDFYQADVASRTVKLTVREQDVLLLLAEGASNKDIAAHLFLGEEQVKYNNRRLYAKLDANDRAHAVAQGSRLGLLR